MDDVGKYVVKALRGAFGPLGTVVALMLIVVYAASSDTRDKVLLLLFTGTWQGLAVWSIVVIAIGAEIHRNQMRTAQIRLASTKDKEEIRELSNLINPARDNDSGSEDVGQLGRGDNEE